MSKRGQALGRWGEETAAKFLGEKGFQILERNARTEYGEIDLVASKGGETIFVEVKTRSSRGFGYPESGVTEQKRMHMLEAAQAYLQAHPDLEKNWRIDVIAVQKRGGDQSPEIVHFEYAVP